MTKTEYRDLLRAFRERDQTIKALSDAHHDMAETIQAQVGDIEALRADLKNMTAVLRADLATARTALTQIAGTRDLEYARLRARQAVASVASTPTTEPWPKFCPICMAEFHQDGTVTPSDLTFVASTPPPED